MSGSHDPAHHPDHGHGHGHGHGHDHGHAHGPDHDHHHSHANQGAGRLKLALAITTAIMLVEFVGGWWTHSLALIADAGHMLADAGSLLLAVLALAQVERPADAKHSYGHGRFPVLAAFANGLLLLLVSAWIAFEAVARLVTPEPVQGLALAGVALIGLVANLLAFALLHGGHEHDLNRRGALAHVLSDLLGSVAALLAGLIIWQTGWLRADPLLSLFAALLIVRTGVRVTRESAHVLLEGAPPGLSLPCVAAELPRAVSGVLSVHHVHAWSITPGDNLMTLHAVLAPSADADQTLSRIQQWLRQTHRIGHVTVQVERQDCAVSADCGADERQ
ncbi:MAG: cation diffusion facilitator family transporter [Panacagrimonas sp.]|nr:cation diffusion facilitator family transporter [Panacagrimonas sp.]MCC2656152.1 cation diffusion facilitator family transporter [Panacagrimonas sp.]